MRLICSCLVLIVTSYSLSWANINPDSLKAECHEHALNSLRAFRAFVTTQDKALLVSGIAEAAKASLIIEILDREFPDVYPKNVDAGLVKEGLASLCSNVAEQHVTEPVTDPKNQLAPFALFLTIFETKINKVFAVKQ